MTTSLFYGDVDGERGDCSRFRPTFQTLWGLDGYEANLGYDGEGENEGTNEMFLINEVDTHSTSQAGIEVYQWGGIDGGKTPDKLTGCTGLWTV